MKSLLTNSFCIQTLMNVGDFIWPLKIIKYIHMKIKLHAIWLALLLFQFSTAQTKELFGVTSSGGVNNLGTIFKTDINGDNFTVLQELKYKNEGEQPDNIKLCEFNSLLYGTTYNGGKHDNGVIFSYNPITDEYLKLHDFVSLSSGDGPYSGLILANNGKMYGTTLYGGLNNLGTLFEYNVATNTLTKKLDFDGVNMGNMIFANVIQASNGKLYGLTNRGGLNDLGVLYEYDYTTETFRKMIDFDGANYGRSPNILVEVENNVLYGTCASGGINNNGTIFEYNISTNILTKKFDFAGVTSGSTPILSLMLSSNGSLYGLTRDGGANMRGVLYEYNINTETFTKKMDLSTEIGGTPGGRLLEANNGKFYGLTNLGGLNNKGVVFEFDPVTNKYTKKIDFDGVSGSQPNGSFMQATNGKLYATTRGGGLGNSGVLFEYDVQTNFFEKKIDFNYADMGSGFRAGFTKGSSNTLYITSSGGGVYGYGTLLEYHTTDNSIIKKYDFSFDEAPQNSTDASLLYASNNKIYGVSAYYPGGGELFEFDLQTNTYTTKISFNNPVLGQNPTELIEATNGKIYGMTGNGGVNNVGVIFEYDFVNDVYLKLFDFDGTNTGGYPLKALFQASNQKLYGMLTNGGANNLGVLFEFDTATNTFTKKFDFSATNPGNAQASLIEWGTGLLYSFTNSQGYDFGTIFEYNLNTHSYTKKIDFDLISTGYSPQYRFLKTSENKLFGLNKSGGTAGIGGSGVLFEYNPTTNIVLNKLNFSSDFGSQPVGSLVEAVTNPLSTEDNNKLKTMHIFPNPVTDKLMISSKSSETFYIEIYNLLGEQVLYKQNVNNNDELKIAHLNSGLYILKVISKSGNLETIKFIKN